MADHTLSPQCSLRRFESVQTHQKSPYLCTSSCIYPALSEDVTETLRHIDPFSFVHGRSLPGGEPPYRRCLCPSSGTSRAHTLTTPSPAAGYYVNKPRYPLPPSPLPASSLRRSLPQCLSSSSCRPGLFHTLHPHVNEA